jgi:hypothetical protein
VDEDLPNDRSFWNTYYRRNTAMQENVTIEAGCETCALRARAQEKPKSLIAWFWRWHTTWCPGWKAYVTELQSKGLEVPQV